MLPTQLLSRLRKDSARPHNLVLAHHYKYQQPQYETPLSPIKFPFKMETLCHHTPWRSILSRIPPKSSKYLRSVTDQLYFLFFTCTMWLLKNLVKLVKTNFPLCMYMPPESSDKVDNKVEIKTKRELFWKVTNKDKRKKSTKGKANGGRKVASLSPTAQPPKQLLNFEFLSSLKFLKFLILKIEKMIYSIMLVSGIWRKDSVSHIRSTIFLSPS